jgi:hypothetical protein
MLATSDVDAGEWVAGYIYQRQDTAYLGKSKA